MSKKLVIFYKSMRITEDHLNVLNSVTKGFTYFATEVLKFCFRFVSFLFNVPVNNFSVMFETEPPFPGYYQSFLGGKCILLKDTIRQPE